jgi:RNA polymerase sigma-70 factor (ECF subfamily)
MEYIRGAKTRVAAFLFPGIIRALTESFHEGATVEFEAVVLPHLDSAYTLARYLTRNDADAQDVVQDAALRALKYFDGFRGTDGASARAWFLAIVRNTVYTRLQRHRADAAAIEFNEELHSDGGAGDDVETAMDLRQAIDALPLEFREVIVLREVEGLSYKEISDVAGIPVGTVMSRLARARKRLQVALSVGTEGR